MNVFFFRVDLTRNDPHVTIVQKHNSVTVDLRVTTVVRVVVNLPWTGSLGSPLPTAFTAVTMNSNKCEGSGFIEKKVNLESVIYWKVETSLLPLLKL